MFKKAAAVMAAVLTMLVLLSPGTGKRQADSIVLRSEDSTVVIDCGEKGDGKEIVNFLEEKEVSTVDYLIITHYDRDHVGGASKVINKLDVKNVLAPDYDRESEEMDKYNKALKEKNITPQRLTSDISFELGDIRYEVYAPKKTDYGQDKGDDNDNDFSLITKVTHGKNVLLFTGDAMEQRLEEVMDIGKCTLLKVPYHGRKLQNIKEFVNAVDPDCAVVCTSKSEFSSQVQNLLLEKNIPTYSTCFNGTITAVSDGKEIKISSEK